MFDLKNIFIIILALEMASPANQHCANCIGTLFADARITHDRALTVAGWCRRGGSVLRVRRPVTVSHDADADSDTSAAGRYQCTASNVAGTARSAVITVLSVSRTYS